MKILLRPSKRIKPFKITPDDAEALAEEEGNLIFREVDGTYTMGEPGSRRAHLANLAATRPSE